MTTKLTLTLDESVISSAKKYAEKKGKSLSKIVETYLQSISSGSEENEELSPRVRKLMGSITLSEDFDYKSALGDAITRRYK